MEHRTDVNRMIVKAKQEYYEDKLSSQDQKACFKVINELVKPPSSSLSSSENPRELCSQFATFFSEKIQTIRDNITGAEYQNVTVTVPSTVKLSQFALTDVDELEKTIRSCPDKSCCLDPLLTNLLKKTLEVHLPPLLNIINTSYEEGKFPKCLKTAIVTPLLKKTNLDTLKNYRPVPDIPFLSKVLEKIAVKRLLNHL